MRELGRGQPCELPPPLTHLPFFPPQIPTGGILPTGLKFRHKLPTGIKLPRLPKLPTGLKFPLHGKKHGRRLTTTTFAKFALPLPTGSPKFVIPTGPKLVVPTGFKKGPLPGIIGGGRRLHGLKKFIPTGPIFVIPTGPKFVLPTGLKKFPGNLGRRMH